MFCVFELTKLPKTDFLLTTHNKTPAITGNKIPLDICANLIISMGLISKEEKNTPSSKIHIQTLLNCVVLIPFFQPKQPLAT